MRTTSSSRLGALLLCILALPLMASRCGKDDTSGDDTGPLPYDTSDSVVTPDEFWDLDHVYGVPNLDDDDGNGTVDWEEAGAASDNDLAIVAVPEGIGDLALTLEGSSIRVWFDGAILLDESTTTATLTGTEAKQLGVEFADTMVSGSLTFEGDGHSNVVSLMAAPLTLNNHFQAADHFYMVTMSWGGYSNVDMVNDLEAILGKERFTSPAGNTYGQDVWVQDEFEFGYTRVAGHDAQLIVDSIRSGGGNWLDPYPENEIQAPDIAVATWGNPMGANSLDSFGNLETSPPVTVDGVEYPLGRIYFGGSDRYYPSQVLWEKLEEQRVQDPFMPDTTWLCVGHIDEFLTFVPDTSAEKGFKMLVTDVDLAWELLDNLDPDQSIPKYTSAHHVSTIGELVNDQSLRDYNNDLQVDHIEPAIELMKAELGMTDDDVIRTPGIFEPVGWCGDTALSLIPGLINLAVFTEEGADAKLLIADPFLRGNNEGQEDDPMIAAWDALMPPGNETYYVDDWSVYHEGMGEVHCASNIHRAAGPDWWSVATHLIGGEE